MLRKAIVWGTVLSGVAAAYLMFRRGESFLTIAKKTTMNPVGSLFTELKGAH